MRLIEKHQQANGKGLGKINKQTVNDTRYKIWDYYSKDGWQYDTSIDKWITPLKYKLDEEDTYRLNWDEFYGPVYEKLDSARNIMLDYWYNESLKDLNQNPNYDTIGGYATGLGSLLIPNDTLFGRVMPNMKDPEVRNRTNKLHSLVNRLNVSKLKEILPKIKLNASYYDLAKYAHLLGIRISDIPTLIQFANFGNEYYEKGISF